MHHTIMRPLAAQLTGLGWQVEGFSYNSLAIDARLLFERLAALTRPGEPQFLVGHSLGGVLARQYAEHRELPEGSRIVTLGSPHRGAAVARRLAQWNLEGLMGNAHQHGLLENHHGRYLGDAELGSLAGNAGIGMGRLILPKEESDGDGTVLVEETRLQGFRDHIILPHSHTSMLFSSEVARQTDNFLRYGKFSHIQQVEEH
ncbi:lipase family alpha/beta hydrolase [Ferrimonas sediminicola]